jgi:hypothetical protein
VDMGTNLLQGDSEDGACPTRAVFQRRQCPLPSAWVEFFLSVVFMYSLCFSSHNLPLYYSILLEYLLACS